MADPEFAVPVRDLDVAGKPFRFPVRAAWLRGALEGTTVDPTDQEGRLELRLSKSGTDVVVRGKLEARVTAPCARCLEPAPVAVSETISALAVPAATVRDPSGGRRGGDDDDLSPDQADFIAYDGETVVLDDLVRDELLLGIPMIPLCSEACAGIQPRTPPEEPQGAAVDEVDPRLRPLLRLKNNTQ
jgi:uncharacterized protein